MNSRHWLLVIRLCTLLAILTSAALLMHYLAPEETGFCGARSGCEAVRKSGLGSGIEPYFVPLSGVVAYAVVYWITFWPGHRQLLRGVGALGGVIALGLVIHQALVIGAFCWMCVLVDTFAVVIAFASIAYARATVVQTDPLQGWAWFVFFGLAVAVPNVWMRVKSDDGLPSALHKYEKPDGINVFEFSDFQCPHCRRLHPILKAVATVQDTPVHVIRFHVPLPFHPLAEDAARAAVCAAAMGKEHEMANLLFEQDLTKGVWFTHAKSLGLNETEFANCLNSDTTTETLADSVDLFNAIGARGLPTTYVGSHMLKGSQNAPVVLEAFKKAASPKPFQLPGPVYITLILVVTAAVTYFGRTRPTVPPTPATP